MSASFNFEWIAQPTTGMVHSVNVPGNCNELLHSQMGVYACAVHLIRKDRIPYIAFCLFFSLPAVFIYLLLLEMYFRYVCNVLSFERRNYEAGYYHVVS